MTSQRIFVASSKGRSAPFMPGENFIWKATGAETNGALDFSELALEPDVRTPEHIHHGNDEIYYLLDGSIRFKVGADIFDASPGAFVFIPRGTPHTWVNNAGRSTRVLLLFTPGGMDGYFEELKPLLPDLMVGLEDMSKVDKDVLRVADDIMRRYQYELVGPPLA